jgi:hypothetical protein
MKESAIFKLAQMAVLDYPRLNYDQKLEILRVLMEKEDVAIFCEKQKEKETEE